MTDLHDILSRTLLVGLTDDASSTETASLGFQLARNCGCPLELVHAIPDASLAGVGVPGPDLRALDDERRQHVWAQRAHDLEELDPVPEHLEDVLRIETGAPAKVLVERARALDAGAILVGPHRRRLFDFGSTARALLAHAPCPVWSHVGPARAFSRLLVPVDMSEDSRHAGLVATHLARRLDIPLHLLHAFEGPAAVYPPKVAKGEAAGHGRADEQAQREWTATRERFAALVAELNPGGRQVTSELVNGPPVDAVLAHQRDGDLTVMATQGLGKLSSVVLGSVTYGVLRESEQSVLAVPHPTDLDQRSLLAVDSFHTTA